MSHVSIGNGPWWECGIIFDCNHMLVFTMQNLHCSWHWQDSVKSLLPRLAQALCSLPNCLGYAHIILMSDGPQSIPMSHCTGSLRLLPKQLWRFRACVYFMGQLTLGQYMILPNKHHAGEHCDSYSSMAQRTVGQLWVTRGYGAMW